MNWYNYIFAVIAAGGVLGTLGFGMPIHASNRNVGGVLYCIALAIFWAVIFYWNVYA